MEYVDRLADGGHSLAGVALRTSQPGNLRPGPAGADAQLEPAAGEQVQARAGLGQHLRWPQRQVGNVGEEPQPAGSAEERADEGEGVEKLRHVGVVLDGYKVEARRLRRLHVVAQSSDVSGMGGEEHPELQPAHDASWISSMPA